jgi:Subtilase family
MYESLHSTVGTSRLTRIILHSLCAGAFSLSLAGAVYAAPLPANLGNGLDKVVQAKSKIPAFQNSAVADEGNATFDSAITDAQGRIMVRVNPAVVNKKPLMDIHALANTLTSSIGSAQVKAINEGYRGVGVMDMWVAVDDVPALATSPGVRSVILEIQPQHSAKGGPDTSAANGDAFVKIGTTFDQGVTQHRVDQINKLFNPLAPQDFEGTGMTIGLLSNCYAANAAHPATLDVSNFDLPGDPLNPVNTTPVFVLEDDPVCTSGGKDDEGRGMVQIAYKMAPKATLGFATADDGEVQFANNIRALAGIGPSVQPGQTFAADTIADDVSYFDEPVYQDGIISAGIDDVTAAGVSYFSSSANHIGTNGYESAIRLIPNGTGLTAATNTALVNTNIDLTNVPTNLYAGGFHNFNPNPDQIDVAQTVNVAANNTVRTVLQWNDPYDQADTGTVGGQIYANTGTYVNAPVVFDQTSTPPLPQFTQGQGYQIVEQATSGDFDAIVSIIAPDGTTVLTQDTGTDETVIFVAPQTGQYKISVNHFATTAGDFSIVINTATFSTTVMSDWNLLAFRTDTGAYVPASSLTVNNLATNEPIEMGFVNRTSSTILSIQYVLARGNTPAAGARVADRIRYITPGNGRGGYGPQEYFTYNTVTTGGHAMAKGTNGVAAYSAFRPNLPETFTSPGPISIYFDGDSNPLTLPEVRLQPRIAAADGANISANEGLAGLGSDVPNDADAEGNFSGTSAAAPHAAAIGALVLQAHGGRHSLTPAQMTAILQNSTFRHDLDPSYASGIARTDSGDVVKITINSDGSALQASGANTGTGANDANAFAVTYTGEGTLTSLVFNPHGVALEGGAVSGGVNGYLDGTAPNITYFDNIFPGMDFAPANKAFTIGSQSTIPLASVTASFSNGVPLPAPANQSWTMTLAFDNSFTSGNVLHFTVGRDIQHWSSVAGGTGSTNGQAAQLYLADLYGGGTVLPSGAVNLDGMTFSGTTTTGSFTGVLRNRVQKGYSPVDGYGFINAQQAVGAPTP